MHLLLMTKRAWTRGLPVRVTELLDGENVRLGVVRNGGDEWKFVADERPDLLNDQTMGLLNLLADDKQLDVWLHGVLIGSEHCKLNDYGRESSFILTDIETEEGFIDDDIFTTYSEMFGFEIPPSFLKGRFEVCLPSQFSRGQTSVAPGSTINTPFKERIGIVVKPLMEAQSAFLGGRLIGKVFNPKCEEVFNE